jgi:hypothetical protein
VKKTSQAPARALFRSGAEVADASSSPPSSSEGGASEGSDSKSSDSKGADSKNSDSVSRGAEGDSAGASAVVGRATEPAAAVTAAIGVTPLAPAAMIEPSARGFADWQVGSVVLIAGGALLGAMWWLLCGA